MTRLFLTGLLVLSAATVVGLAYGAPTQADESVIQISVHSEFVAALECLKRHYDYFVWLPPAHALCLTTNVGAPNALNARAYLREPKP